MVTTTEVNRDYIVALLLGTIDILSRELSLKINLEPETIASKTLLDMCLQLQHKGTEQVLSSLNTGYGYGCLIERIDEVIRG